MPRWKSLQACLAIRLPVCMRGTPTSSSRSCCEITMTLYNCKLQRKLQRQLQMPLWINVASTAHSLHCTIMQIQMQAATRQDQHVEQSSALDS